MAINLGDAILYFAGDTTKLMLAADAGVGIIKESLQKAHEEQKSFASSFAKTMEDAVKNTYDSAKGTLEKIGTEYRNTMTAIKVAATGIFAVGTKEASDFESGVAQLDARLKSTSGSAGMTREALLGLVDSLMKTSAFTNDAIISGENLMLTFTQLGKNVFPESMQAALDMSVALGQDLFSSVMQLGKALNNPIEGVAALQRVGVRLSESQKEQVLSFMAVNDIASAQGVILKELATEFGGSALAETTTFAGMMKVLRREMADASEGIARGFLPILKSLAGVLVDGVKWTGEFIDEHQGLIKIMVGVVLGLKASAIAFSLLATSLGIGMTAMKLFTAATLLGPPAVYVLSAAWAAFQALGLVGFLGSAATALRGLAMQILASAAAATAIPIAIGVAVVQLVRLSDAAWKAWDAHRQLQAIQEHLPMSVKQAEGALIKAGVAYDATKIKTMAAGDAVAYLSKLYYDSVVAAKEAAAGSVTFNETITRAITQTIDDYKKAITERVQEQLDYFADAARQEKDYLDNAARTETDYQTDSKQRQDDYLSDLAREQQDHIDDTAAESASALQAFARTLTDMASEYGRKVQDIERDTAEGIQQIESDYRKASQEFWMSEAKAYQDYQDGVADRATDHSNKIADIKLSETDRVKELTRQLAETEGEDAKAKIERQIADEKAKADEDIAKAERDYQIDELRNAREFEQARSWAAQKATAEEAEWQEKRAKFIQHQQELEQEAYLSYQRDRAKAIETENAKLAEKAEKEKEYLRDLQQKQDDHDRDMVEKETEHERMLLEKQQDHDRDLLEEETKHNRELKEKDAARREDFKQALIKIYEDNGVSLQEQIKQLETYGLDASDLKAKQADRDKSTWIRSWSEMEEWYETTYAQQQANATANTASNTMSIWGGAIDAIKQAWMQVVRLFNMGPEQDTGFGDAGQGPEQDTGFGDAGQGDDTNFDINPDTGLPFASGGTVGGARGNAIIEANEEGPEGYETPDGQRGILGNGLRGFFSVPVGTRITNAVDTARQMFAGAFAEGGIVSDASIDAYRRIFQTVLNMARSAGKLAKGQYDELYNAVGSGWEDIQTTSERAGKWIDVGGWIKRSTNEWLDLSVINGLARIDHRQQVGRNGTGGSTETTAWLDMIPGYARGGIVAPDKGDFDNDESHADLLRLRVRSALDDVWSTLGLTANGVTDWQGRIQNGWGSIMKTYRRDGKIVGYDGFAAGGYDYLKMVVDPHMIAQLSYGNQHLSAPNIQPFAAGGTVAGGAVNVYVAQGATFNVREHADIARINEGLAAEMKRALVGVYK